MRDAARRADRLRRVRDAVRRQRQLFQRQPLRLPFDVGHHLARVTLAVREGLLSVVSVLSSLYPASTVVLAWLVLRERFAPMQRVGLLLAVPAAVLMAI